MKKLIDEKYLYLEHFNLNISDYCIYKMMVKKAHILKSTPLRALGVSFHYFVSMLQTY